MDFQPQSIVKLFLGEYTDTPLGLSADQKEARRLQEEITSITNEGSTETRLRQLIAECKEFLSSKPRDLVRFFVPDTMTFISVLRLMKLPVLHSTLI